MVYVYLTLMLTSDCSQYVYGAYGSRARACEARARCEQFEKVWQYQQATEANGTGAPQSVRKLAGELKSHPYAPQITPQPLNYCTVQRVAVDWDDVVADVNCADDNLELVNGR